ncbi:MAG: YbgC/FadM family acyl-CoA thioesterase [Planctomycetia bacterium]|nr:YbgC/FadM family acyl-CoA thioesterase [Planctomycetia bacterium]
MSENKSKNTKNEDSIVPDSIPTEGSIDIRVRYQETDSMGVVHHGNYFTWFEMGRTELLRQVAGISYRDLAQSETLLAVVKAECSYKSPARYDDVLTLKTRLGKVTRVIIEHHYELYRGYELLAVGRTVLAAVDRSGRLTSIPLWFRGKKIADMAIAKASHRESHATGEETAQPAVRRVNTVRIPHLAPGTRDVDRWLNVPALTDFHLYWNQGEEEPKTSLQMCYDDENFYFKYEVQDADVVLVPNYTGQEDVLREDRAELFFDTGDDMSNYYALEIDPLGRTLDYQATFYRKFNRNWNWPDLNVQGRLVPGGYMIEGSLSLATLRDLDILKSDNSMRIGCFRTAFRHSGDGNILDRWMSWIHPGTAVADFHVPSALGRAVLS